MKRPIAAVSAALLTSGVLTCVTTSAYAATPSAPAPESAAATRADSLLRANPGAVQGASGEAYQAVRTKVDASGAAHTRYTRTYHGLRVYGGDFVIHTAPNGTMTGASVGLDAPLTLSTAAKVSSAAAAASARRTFSGTLTSVGAPELFVDASSGKGRLAWETVAAGWKADKQTPSKLHVITDATTGKVIGSYDEIETVVGSGQGIYTGSVSIDTTLSGSTYQMVDPSHGNGRTCDMNNGTSTCTTFTDADNAWGNGTNSNRQSAGVDAHFGAAKTFDYFKNVHGRNGIFGNGTGVPSRVHYGSNYVNAFWDGSQMTYGDGSGNSRPLVSLDVAGHEMSHGVTEALAGLVYSGESGGLNEATSDIFGNMVEFYAAAPSDPGDYDVGEKININGNGTPLRYMYNPGLDGASHTCWSTSTKNVDVHYSSGPANHFFFNLAEGTGSTAYGTSPLCGSAPAVTGIGRAKAEKIWYRALDLYFTSSTSYVNTSNPANTARAYTLRAATDLYGNCSTEYKTVQAAWTAVNVAGNDAPCGSTGNDFSVSLSPTSGSVNPGSAVSTTVSTATTSGTAQTVTFSASGLPTGATASFSPSSVTSGGSSTLTISTSASTPAGTYSVNVTGTGTSANHSATYQLTVNGTGGCTGAGQKLGNPGFESGNTVWSSTSGVIGQYGSSGQPTHGGTWNAWLDGYGTTHTDTLSQAVSLPAGCSSYNFSFWLHIDSSESTTTTAYDTLRVQVLNSSGTVLATLATYSNLNKAAGYSQKSFSLAAYAGQTVTLKFTGAEDISLQTSFVIDDTAVNVS
ncbi:M4 family metallopeptidase [Micromonospora sp. DR5-3]|uniref:M4 family metallopeptidase n=1 Tax=unclassified Micromonospora TaxID=2617518 RepID=UPI0011D5D84F|nr:MULTISPECIES: M4 family metallopeptidase [unclassified Micromonospora]MCW3813041.1 M4 family metallopeptidase [Micromonospora sp. DR5-3]TYC25969.1 M4 family peptidase [Micromonospora sp. MP36]